jgi:hypothetical protein
MLDVQNKENTIIKLKSIAGPRDIIFFPVCVIVIAPPYY